MRKIITLMLAAVCLLASLSGCKDQQSDPSSPTSPSTNHTRPTIGETVQNTETSPTETTAPPATEETVPQDSSSYDPNVPLFWGATYDDDYHCVNCNGEILYGMADMLSYDFGCGLSVAYSPSTRKMGFVDSEGVFIIDPQYEDAGPFSPVGLAPVEMNTDNGEKWGFINTSGELVIPCIYDQVSLFSEEGYAVVVNRLEDGSNAKGVIDMKGNICIPMDASYGNILLTPEYAIITTMYHFVNSGDGDMLYDYTGKLFDSVDDLGEDTYLYDHGIIYKFDYVLESSGDTPSYSITTSYLHNGTFEPISNLYEESGMTLLKCDVKQVSTTKTGRGFKIIYNGNDLSSYEYDYVGGASMCSRYLLAYKFNDASGSTCTVDIYDMLTGEQTAYDVPWGSYYTLYPYSNYIPDGYFIIGEFRNDDWCYGIMDYTGNLIMNMMYEGIVPNNYEVLLTELFS